MKLVSIEPTPADDKKKFIATFDKDGRIKRVKFGSKGSNTFIDGASLSVRNNYRARHARDVTFPVDSPAMLSFWITWGDSQDINKNISAYKKKHNL
jgi:hypothetical protein